MNIILVIVIVFAVGTIGYFSFIKKPAPIAQQTPTPAQTNNSVSSTPTQKDETANWKTYQNSKYSFSLKYPSTWILEESSQSATDSTGVIVWFRSPETAQLVKEQKIHPGHSVNLKISFWPSINNEFARGGGSIGDKNYSSLADYFADKNAFQSTRKIGDIIIAGQNAYEVSIGGNGVNYGVMIEHSGIYELSFDTAWDKSELGSTEKQILSTFQFTK